MVSYENFFLFILISILSPVIGLLILIIYNAFEKQIYLLEIENSKVSLEKELETAKYIRLNQQIQPHFLFNALNSMLGIIRLKRYELLNESFEHMVLYLRSKYKQEQVLHTLKEEIEYTNHFLAIQQLRYGNRLQVKWEIEDGIEKNLIIPYLVQTLVENAFKHGIDHIEEIGVIHICIKIIDNDLMIKVEDNGPGFGLDSIEDKDGIGLDNISRRLNLLFGDSAHINIDYTNSNKQNGGKVVVMLPKISNYPGMEGEVET